MMTPKERADQISAALRQPLIVLANPDSHPAAVAEARGIFERVVSLLDSLHPPPEYQRSPEQREPHVARAHARDATPDDDARQAVGLHRLRQGRDQCAARRRDGAPCGAPAVKGTLVCRRHGGGAPQVKIKARYTELLAARFGAALDYDQAKGAPGEFDALCKWSRADNAVAEYEAKLSQLAELRVRLMQQNASARVAG